MRALLVVNPNATTTTPRTRDVIVRALGSQLDLMVTVTTGRGHATDLAAEARANGFAGVVVHGGDGTVNEVVNGLLCDGPGDDVPVMSVVPGGHANVFNHALGLPRDPVEATAVILENARAGQIRTIGLAKADDRWFTFNAGLGIDAEVLSRVDDLRARAPKGIATTAAAYAASLVSTWAKSDRHNGRMRALVAPMHGEDETTDEVVFAIVQNTAPWTLLGERPLQASPDASLDAGIDFVAMRSLSTPQAVRTLTGMLGGKGVTGGDSLVRHDLASLVVSSPQPVAFQVDGEHVGEVQRVHFTSIPAALRVVAPIPAGQPGSLL